MKMSKTKHETYESQTMFYNFLRNFEYLRKNLSLSRQEIFQQLGFSFSTWTNWNNQQSLPAADKVLYVAQFFGISVETILLRDIEKEKLEGKENYSDDKARMNYAYFSIMELLERIKYNMQFFNVT